MMSYLYPEDEVTFDKSGFGPLPDMLVSYAEEEANSYFELYFEYPLFSSHERGDYNQIYVNMSDYLIEGNQVTYKPSHSREPHAFRIYKTEKQVERGIILVWARTRTADLRGNPVRKVVSKGAPVSSALRALKLASEETHPFSFTTNIQSNISFEKNQTNVLDALAGEEESILAITGGQMIRTNNNIYIGINESSKNVVEFRLGKNIEGISYEVDYSNVVTAVIPFYTQTYKLVDDIRDEIVRDSSGNIVKNADGTTKYNRTVGKKRESLDDEIIVYGDTVFSQYANDYSTPFYSFVEIRDDREDVGVDQDPLPPFTKADINSRAADWFEWEENLGVDEPEVSVTVDVHDISQSSEYSHDVNLAKLETLNVFDKALVYVPEVGIDMDMEINYIRYDGVAEKNLEVRLGTTLTSLTETVLSPQQRAFNQRVQQLDREIAKTSLSSDGKSRIYWMATKPTGSFEVGDLWFDVSLDGGIYVWDGYDWVAKLPSDFAKLIEDSINAVADAADAASQSAKDANDLADKLADDFDKLDISGVNLALGSDTPKVLNEGETKYFWNLENPLSDYALKSGDKLTVSMYAELFSESEKFKNWSDSYYQFMEHNTKTTGNLAINDLGLVGGSFVPDNPLWSYTPPTTGTSEAQLLTIRGVLQQYLATNEKKWLDTAHFLTDALLNYYYPSPSIPSTPDSAWVPHWLVNVNAPFKSRRWATDGEVNFVNGVGKANIPAIFRVWSARTADSTLEYLWAPDSPVIGTELEIESTDLKYKENTGTIVLKDKTFTGKGLIVYTSWDGEIINVGDKCEAYPVWRPLEEGEIACAVDALPWALDVFQLWYEATGDEVWLQAVESTKASIVSASDVSNTEYFIKPGADGEKVLKDGVTAFSTRSPKETYTNKNGMIIIDYPASSGEASLGTWVGDNRALNSRSWIEVKVGSDKKEKIQIVIDEFADYDPDKRWIADILLSGEGLTEDKHQYISLTNKDFYKADRVVWGSAYDKTTNASVIASGNSSVTIKNNLTQLKNNHPVTQFNFKRGDEGGWLGWAQAMLGIWSYTFPFNMNYKTNDDLYFVVNDSKGVRWEYILPKTGDVFKTITIKADLFTSAAGGKLSTENYQSIVIEAIDEKALLYIDYIGFVDYFNGSSYSNVSLTYKQPSALKLALSYIKPAPSRNPLDYAPYIMPFDYHYINYQLSDMRGAIYSGYQVPWIYQENVFKEADKALATNLRFLSDAQDAYQSAIGVDGFFAPIYWWNYRTDYGQNEPNSWGITGNWGSVWGGFQYRTISDVARVFRKAPNNKQAYDIFMRFIKGMDANWTSTVDGFPTAFVEDKAPYTDQKDSHMVSNFMRALLYGWESSIITAADKTLIQKLLNKCYEYLDTLFNPIERFDNPVEGTWSPSPELHTWFNYWGGDILDGLAIARTSTAFNFGGDTGQYSGELSLNTQNPNISLTTEPIKLTNMEYGKKYRFNSTIKLTGNDVAIRFDKPKLGITLSNTSKPFSLVVNKIKVEAGSKPTEHTLALSETVDVMAFSRFEKTLNGFRTTVRNMKSDKTTVTQLANMWRTTTELVDGHTSQITSMGFDINLRVSKGELLSQMNIEAGNVLIQSGTNKLNVTPETTYIENGTIKSAMIASLDAGKIRTGELDASKVTVSNIDANNITANKTAFVKSAWNAINSEVEIDGSGIKTQNSSGDFSRIVSGELRSFNGDSSSTAILGSGRSQYYDAKGSQFILGNTLHGRDWLNSGTLQVTHTRSFAIGRYDDYSFNNGNFHPYISLEYPPGKTGDEPLGIVRLHKAVYLQKDIYAGNNAVSGLSKITFNNGGNIESQPSTSNMLIEASNKLVVYATGTNAFEIDRGYMYLKRNLSMEGNNITNQSDRRLKTNIVDTPIDSLSAISKWKFKAFDRIKNGTHDDIGLIAQDTSEIVLYDEENDIYNINSSKQIMMNSHGIQLLNIKVDDEVNQLKSQIESLKYELAQLKGAQLNETN